MFYLLQHMWLYLVLAAALGASLMWLLRHWLMRDKVAEVHATWQSRWYGLEGEHLRVLKDLQSTSAKAVLVPGLEAELGQLKENYRTLTGQHAALDAEWKRKYAASEADWRGKLATAEKGVLDVRALLDANTQERTTLQANLQTCSQKCTELEREILQARAQIDDWARRFAGVEQDATEAKAQVVNLTGERDQLRGDAEAAAAQVRRLTDQVAAIEADLKSRYEALDADWKAKWATLEAQYKVTEERLGGDIERIEGIGLVFGPHLRSVGIAWVADLIDQCGTADGRAAVAEKTGLTTAQLLTWTNMADLLRIPGMTPDWAELLHAAGVDSVKELKHRGAENLRQKMEEVNVTAERKISPTVPDVMTVNDWVQRARTMEYRITD